MYVGVDYHEKFSITTKMDDRGEILEQVKVKNDPQTLVRFAESLTKGSKTQI